MIKKMKPSAYMGRLKKEAKARGTSLRKLSMVTGVPLASIYLYDRKINGLGQEAALKIMRCLRMSAEEWCRLTGDMMKLTDWQPSAEQWDLLYRDQRTRK